MATLPLLADGQVQGSADRAGRVLRNGINEVITRLGVDACVYGESSIVNLFLQPRRHALVLDRPDSPVDHRLLMDHPNQEAYHRMRCALILHGVDFPLFHGWVSAAHSDADLEQTIRAFEAAFRLMRDEGAV
ncbi:MAG: hypothetical protein M5R38_08025 [Candidatus Methylomirabilis sp.]|nr:hypothetical protein [Candidatus Methylomirabilis sp.]